MKQLKKTILTLALLLTAATGAWAQSAVASIGSENYTTLQAAFTAAETGQTIKLLSDVTQTGGVGKSDGKAVTFDLNGHIYTCTDYYSVMATNNSQITIIDSSTGTPGGIKSELALFAQENGKIIIKAGRYNIGGSTAEELLEYFPLWCVEMYSGYTLQDITPADAQGFCVGVVAPASSGPEVAWNKAEKTGTFTMPGGNVTLEPDYYPQATVAEGAVTAAGADARATTDDPLVKVDATKLTGAKKLMYFVSNSGTAPAYDAEGWTEQLPTAEGFTEAGTVYVWYYPVGTDEGDADATATYSDGDMNATALAVTIAAAPTYAVTFAEGTDPNEWSASPNADVKKGQTVTVTYTGQRKVMGVKAEKKAAAGIVNPVVGQIIGSDGNNYAANATLPDGVTKVAMIAYVSGSNGLALALTDEDAMTWDNSAPSNKGKTAPELCSALNTSKAVTGGTWKLPSQDEWKQMFSANGGNEGSYSGLNTAIGNAGGIALLESEEYWSSSEVDEWDAWLMYLEDGNASWSDYGKHYSRCVRACLVF